MAGLSGDGTDGTGQDGLAEQAGGHLGEHDGAAAALVEERVQLDDVGRHHAAAVVQQLHDQVRLAVGGAAGDCGAGPGGDAGIEEVDVEADVDQRSEEHTSELQSLMRTSYAVSCLKTKKKPDTK